MLYHGSIFGQSEKSTPVTQNVRSILGEGADPIIGGMTGEIIIGSGGGSESAPEIIVTPFHIANKRSDGSYLHDPISNFGKDRVAIGFKKGNCPGVYFIELSGSDEFLIRIMFNPKFGIEYISPKLDELGSFSLNDYDGDAFYVLTTSSHIYVSRDTFKTFQMDTTGFSGASLNKFALDSLQYIYAATSKGIFKQNPDSNKWHSLNTFNLTGEVSSIFVDRKQNIYAGSANGQIYKSTDFGSTWAKDNLWNNGYIKQFSDDTYGDIFVITSGINTGDKIFKFPSGGSSWVQIDAGITNITNNSSVYYNSLNGNSAIFAATNFGLFVSTDRGSTWTEQDKDVTSGTIYGYAKANNGRDIASNVQGISFKNPSDTVWQKTYPVNGFISGLPIYSDPLGNLYTFIHGKNNSFVPSSILKSVDNGNTWLPDTLGLSSTIGNLFYVDELGVEHMAGQSWSSYAPGFVFKKAVNNSWTLDTTGTGASTYMYGTSFLSDGKGYLYLSGDYPGKIFRRPISGNSWVVDTVGIPNTVNYFNFMSAHPDGTIFGTGIYASWLYKRINNAWAPVTIPAGDVITAMSIDNTGNIFIALENWAVYPSVDIGVYYSKDKGATWDYVALDSIQVNSLVSFGASTYAITNGYGVYLLNPGNATAVKNSNTQLKSFVLYQNYPNPFNPSTVISYQMPTAGHVVLKVYDILGRDVETLVDEEKSAGNYKLTFNGSRLASGMYFYQLKTGAYLQTKKLMLIK